MNIEAQAIRELAVQEITTKTDTRDILAHATKSFRDKRLDGWTLIDVDAHHSEMSSWSDIVEYLDDPIMLHHAREFRSRTGGAPGLSNHMPGIRYQDVGGRIRHQQKLDEPVDDKSVHRDVTLVRRSIEALGLDYQVLFPGNMLALGTHPQQRVEAELARRLQPLALRHVLDKDDRIKSLLYLPLGEPEYCLRIIKELAGSQGRPRLHGDERALRSRCTHNCYIPIYRELEERGLPLAFHAGPHWHDEYIKQLDVFMSMHAISFVLCNMVHLTNWIVHGLPERFPKLKTIWIESGLAWLPFMMQRLDNSYMMRPSEAPLLEEAAERLHARDVLHRPADGDVEHGADARRR